MERKNFLLVVLVLATVIVGIGYFRFSQKEKAAAPEEHLEHIVKAAEEVLDGDILQVSKTELIATLMYSHETGSENIL